MTRHCLPIGAVGSHSVVSIGDGDDARKEWDLVPHEPVRIAVSVDPFMMMSHYRSNFTIVVDLPQDPLADGGVLFHLAALIKGERSGLLEKTRGEPDLPNIVHQAAEVSQLLIAVTETEACRNVPGVDRDRRGMTGSVLITRI